MNGNGGNLIRIGGGRGVKGLDYLGGRFKKL